MSQRACGVGLGQGLEGSRERVHHSGTWTITFAVVGHPFTIAIDWVLMARVWEGSIWRCYTSTRITSRTTKPRT
jgi:hypothetical protein